MSCELQGHVLCEDAGSEPKMRCVYCGSWFNSECEDDDYEDDI